MPTIYRFRDARGRTEAIDATARALLRGALALIPTETVYGIAVAVSAFSPADGAPPEVGSGYRRIFSLKRRDLAQTVPLLVAGIDDIDRYGVDVAPEIRRLAAALWPGALTIVMQASDRVPAFMRAADGTVALRASASPIVASLVRACGCPLATTSANTHARPAPASFDEIEQRILTGVDIAIDAGATACRDASTVVCPSDGGIGILRAGALSERTIADALGGGASAAHPFGIR